MRTTNPLQAAVPALLMTTLLSAGCASTPGSTVTLDSTTGGDPVEVQIPNQSIISETLCSSGQLTPEALDALASHGVAKFISLRGADEAGAGWEEQHAADRGIDFVRLPVDGSDGINRTNALALRREIASATGPVIVYCGSGNRVGALMGLASHEADGMGPDEAVEMAERAGMTRLEGVLRERIANP